MSLCASAVMMRVRSVDMATSCCTLKSSEGNLMAWVTSLILFQMSAPVMELSATYAPASNLFLSDRNFFQVMNWSYSLDAWRVSSCAATKSPMVPALVKAFCMSCSVIWISYWMDSFSFQYSAMGTFLLPPKGVAASGSYA